MDYFVKPIIKKKKKKDPFKDEPVSFCFKLFCRMKKWKK
jgi:hypothetical protein